MVLADGSLVHLGRQVDSSLVTKKGTYEERIGTNTASACATAEWARCAGFSDNDERCSEGRDALLLRCARVAVGTLGIITRISMRCENARYVMKRRVEAHVPVATWATAVASRSGCVDPSGPFGCAEHAMAVWCLGQSEIATCCLETSEADGKSVSSSIGGDVREGGEELRAQFVVGDNKNSRGGVTAAIAAAAATPILAFIMVAIGIKTTTAPNSLLPVLPLLLQKKKLPLKASYGNHFSTLSPSQSSSAPSLF